MKYRVPVSYQMYGHVEVEADSKDEAAEIACGPTVGLPENGSYVEGSFQVDELFYDDEEYPEA